MCPLPLVCLYTRRLLVALPDLWVHSTRVRVSFHVIMLHVRRSFAPPSSVSNVCRANEHGVRKRSQSLSTVVSKKPTPRRDQPNRRSNRNWICVDRHFSEWRRGAPGRPAAPAQRSYVHTTRTQCVEGAFAAVARYPCAAVLLHGQRDCGTRSTRADAPAATRASHARARRDGAPHLQCANGAKLLAAAIAVRTGRH